MRDAIVVGAGGGGPVVAKELAARGLDVLLLEAGLRYADPGREWTHYDNESTNPSTGVFRFGPADRSNATRSPPTRRISKLVLATALRMARNPRSGNSCWCARNIVWSPIPSNSSGTPS